MTFRLRIFLLVTLVALLAIGSTAWLTLTVAARRVTQSAAAAQRTSHDAVQILEAYGRTHGTWAGTARLLEDLSATRGQRIRIETVEGEVVVDTDDLGRPVLSAPSPVVPTPALPTFWGGLPGNVAVPDDAPTRPDQHSMADQTTSLVAAYREAIRTARCLNQTIGLNGAYAVADGPPYRPVVNTRSQSGDPGPDIVAGCAEKARSTTAERTGDAAAVAPCRPLGAGAPVGAPLESAAVVCLQEAFTERTAPFSPVPLRLFVGAVDYGPAQLLGREAIAAVGAALLLAVAGTALVARRLSRPLDRLTVATERVATGDLAVRVAVTGKDELARLSRSFNEMAEAIQAGEQRQRQLTADVAHELRTPLSNLRGYLEALQDGVVAPTPELFASLYAETELHRRMLDDLQVLTLAEAKSLSYHPEPVDIEELLRSAATAHRAVAADGGIELNVDTPAGLVAPVDPHRMRQVLGNLIGNAVRHTGPGGTVTLSARRDGGTVVLSVEDTGCGIAPDDLPHVFDRFWRADRARQRATGGSGLGLTIARRIVQDHSGAVDVVSELGIGTTMRVRLPLSRGV
ncbi:MAG TPA: ATP-binding protein [Actinoplanes sp.]